MRKKITHKLSKEEIEEIIKLIEDGFSPTDIAKKFKVSRQTIYNIKKKYKKGLE